MDEEAKKIRDGMLAKEEQRKKENKVREEKQKDDENYNQKILICITKLLIKPIKDFIAECNQGVDDSDAIKIEYEKVVMPYIILNIRLTSLKLLKINISIKQRYEKTIQHEKTEINAFGQIDVESEGYNFICINDGNDVMLISNIRHTAGDKISVSLQDEKALMLGLSSGSDRYVRSYYKNDETVKLVKGLIAKYN